MIIHSKNLIVDTKDFPAIYIIRSTVNYDKYSIIFQSKFDSDSKVSITNLDYSRAAEILEEITQSIINNKFYLNLKVKGV